jgi:hypothetical protein
VTTGKPPNPEAADDPHLDRRPTGRVQTAPLCLNHLPARLTRPRERCLLGEWGQSEVLRKLRRLSRGNPGGTEVGMSLWRVPLTVCRLPPVLLNLDIAHGITSSVPTNGMRLRLVSVQLQRFPHGSRIVNPLDSVLLRPVAVACLDRVPPAGSVLEPQCWARFGVTAIQAQKGKHV